MWHQLIEVCGTERSTSSGFFGRGVGERAGWLAHGCVVTPLAIAYYRSKLEAVVFMWVPAHVGIACNAYADAVATAYLGNNDTEDASKVVRDAVRTRPCMYTVRREAAENTEEKEIVDRRTYGHMCKTEGGCRGCRV